MGKKSTSKGSDTTTPDPAAAESAFNAALPRMKALSKDDLAPTNVDVHAAIIIALAVSRAAAELEPRARFALLPKELFDPAHLKDLPEFAIAAQHAQVALRSARAQATEAKLPIALVDAATEVKDRMLELLSYQLKRHPVLMKEVNAIRIGTGYKDLSFDLDRLATVYEGNTALIDHDKLNYRATDAADARKLAQQIRKELGEAQSAEEKKWADLAARSWTLLRDTYDEVEDAGRFIYRNEDPEEKFPSLYAGSGGGRPRKSKPKAPAPPPGGGAPGDGK